MTESKYIDLDCGKLDFTNKIELNYLFIFFSIDANTNNIELSLRGPDVKDVDPAPKPAKRKSTDKDEAKPKKKKKRNSESESEELLVQLHEAESSGK